MKDDYEDVDGVLYHQGLLFILETIRIELISQYHNDYLARHFGINKIKNLVSRKHYWPSLQKDIKVYVKGCNVGLSSKTVQHKPYRDL